VALRRRAVAATALLAAACDLELKPYVDRVDGGGTALPELGRDAGPPPPPFEIDPAPPRDAGRDATPIGGKRVFVTSSTTPGNFGGLAQADAMCQSLAERANVPGRFVAWLSTDGVNAPVRITGNGPWYLMDGRLVFPSKLAITTDGPSADIDRDERNNRQLAVLVWTGTQATGAASSATCVNYTNSGATGQSGRTNQTDREWTQSGPTFCTQAQHLYCFEQ
jgi:hypothetical protein